MFGLTTSAPAALFAFLLATKQPNNTNLHQSAVHSTQPPRSVILSDSEKADFHRDGFIIKKGVLQGNELKELVTAGEEQSGSMLASAFGVLATRLWQFDERFARVAFESNLPSLAAQLINTDDNAKDDPIRILQDGFFGLKGNNTGCNFHTDDRFFWPATDESTGVNFWIALSPYRVSEGGGIRVVRQSGISKELADECRGVIRQNGFATTCQIESLAPELHQKLHEASTTFDMEPGDVLIWDRWTFHRSEPFVVASASEEEKLRYTIRYVPASAKADDSPALHSSQKAGECFQGAYYPQVWPIALKSEVDERNNGLE
jgi:hypothetical protein